MTYKTLRPFKNATARQSSDYGLRIVQSKDTPDEATIYFYDEIGFWGITANDFIPRLAAIEAATIHIRINSPGGDVFDALAIANAFRAHPARIVAHIDALAASAASYVAMAANEVRMADNAFVMIHDPWTIAMGNAADFRETANLLDRIGGSIVGEYMKRTNATQAEVVAMMEAETWLTADEALDLAFIDAIDGASTDAKNKYNLSVFAKVPDALIVGAREASTKRDREQALRDAGFTRSEAKAAVAALDKPVLSPRDAGENRDAVNESARKLLATLHSHPHHAHGQGTDRAA